MKSNSQTHSVQSSKPALLALTLILISSQAATAASANRSNPDGFPAEDTGVTHWIAKETAISVTRENVIDRTDRANRALRETLDGLDGLAVKYMVRGADCVVWLNLYRASFAGGGRFGRGLGSCRIARGSDTWSAPFYVRTGALSAGIQLGIDQSDYFLFFPSQEVFKDVVTGNITLGGNAAITLAAWGRSTSAGTDADVMNMEIKKDFIYSYAISRGVYGGLSVEGGLMLPSGDYNYLAYKDRPVEKILSTPSAKAPRAIRGFSELLDSITGAKNQ